ncbi:diacylglycerol kinase family protein [Sphingobacterium sp.]|uniref:diacylglycerol kinase family protein n=2 Tax=Sphingobacterium sp. TaxID=341027 RepID=UPI0028965643|nr:diacylglycerol kinase family protein [Sphingobacterium sp.]
MIIMSKNNFSIKDRLKSFVYAYNGLKITWQEEHNFRIHCIAAILVILFSVLFQISRLEWIAVSISIGFVFVCELLNTSLENLADFVCQENNPKIKRVKDIAAAAVILSSATALVNGLIIFLPKIVSFCAANHIF